MLLPDSNNIDFTGVFRLMHNKERSGVGTMQTDKPNLTEKVLIKLLLFFLLISVEKFKSISAFHSNFLYFEQSCSFYQS